MRMSATRLFAVLGCAILLALPGRAAASQPTKPKRPNILFIYTDDQSYRTLSCYPEAYPWVRTPNIDRLARMGIRFTASYNGSWCAPSRASILTGMHPFGVPSMTLKGPYPSGHPRP